MDSTTLNIITLVGAFLISIIIEMMILPRIIYIAKKKRLFDLPDQRKKHGCPIPRLGGISFMPVILLVTFLLLFVRNKLGLWSDLFLETIFPEWALLICGMHIIYLLGAKDDLVGVSFKIKFLIQFIASLCIVGSGVYISNLFGLFGIYEIPPTVGIPLSILLIMFTTNSINLIDGADGLASGLSAIAFLTYGILFCMFSMWTYASIAFITLGILTTFFYYNFLHPTRKIFMGDTGSLTLGYLLAFMMIRLTNSPQAVEVVPSGFILLVVAALFIPPLDAFRVMLLRMLSGNPPFSPDRNHIHHKLLDLGLSRRRTVLTIIISGFLLFLLNMFLLLTLDCNIVLCLDILLWVGVSIVLYQLSEKKSALKQKEELVQDNLS